VVTSNSLIIGLLCPPYEVALTPWRKTLVGTIVLSQFFKELLNFTVTEVSLPFSKKTTLDPDLKKMNPPIYNIKHVVPETKISDLLQVVHCGMS
jgi:hypothetical protein